MSSLRYMLVNSCEFKFYDVNPDFSYKVVNFRNLLHSGNPNTTRGKAGLTIYEDVKVPTLSNQDLTKIEENSPRYITRHFCEDLIEVMASGGFKFGTTVQYRPADAAQVGRLSDSQEGLQREVFRNRSGRYAGQIEQTTFTNVNVAGCPDPVVVQYEVNDYCSCSSVGPFSKARALSIKESGNPDISAYVVYDLPLLREAILEVISEEGKLHGFCLMGRKVEYGQKDRNWGIEDGFDIQHQRDHIHVWLETTFIKSIDYQHEDEFRLILLKLDRAGNLPDNTPACIINDPRIAGAIVEQGRF